MKRVLVRFSWINFAAFLMVLKQEIAYPGLSKEHLFSTPEFISAKISPDGKTIAQIGASSSGIANLFLRSIESNDCKQISFFADPDIIQFFWSPDSRKILLLKDEDGTGKLQLYGFDVHSGKQIIYTEKFPSATVKLIQISSRENKAIIGLNHRNPRFSDLFVLDLDSGKLNLFFENDFYAKFLFSDDLQLILKMKINDDSSWDIFTEKNELFMHLSAEDAFQTEFISYDAKKNSVYLLDNRSSNTTQLAIQSLDDLKHHVLAFQPESDIDEVLFIKGEPKAFATYYMQKKWHLLDPDFKNDITFLQNRLGPNFEVISQSEKADIWLVTQHQPDQGSQAWIYRKESDDLSLLYKSSQESLAKMYEMEVLSRDGEKLICYYTLPKEYDRGGYVDFPIPLVVFPHGGPFKARDKFEFNPYHQWLADCGYAVLSVNFRLSSGFGKKFVNAGNGQWGGKAHLDVIDAVEACIVKGLTAKGKIAILGGSYGGYESLAAITFTPDYFTCSVAICGPSNLKTVLDNVPSFWEFTVKPLSDKTMFFTKQAFITSMGGNPDDEQGSLYLEHCSPLNHLEKIKVPLLLIHGQNDHVVAEKESRQIYESMKKTKKEVTYILFPDEGHRIAKFANKMMFLDHAELFLSKHLGGKYRPCDQNLISNSSAKVLN